MHPARLLRKRASARLVERIVTAVAYEATAQTAPDTNPIFYTTGTNAWSSRFARLMPRQNHSAGTRESLLQCNIADNWAALRFMVCCQKSTLRGPAAVPQLRLLKANKKGPPTEAG